MRIRKHAKLSPLTYAAKPGSVHICQLNQSPWDVITFPLDEEEEEASSSSMQLLSPPPPPNHLPSPPSPLPPPPPHCFLFDGCDSYPTNGSFNDSIQSDESAMLSPPGWDITAAGGFSAAVEEEAAEQEEKPILCCKTDGKSWQCKREAKEGHAFCEHHLERLKNYTNNLAHPTKTEAVKKPTAAPAEDSGRSRRGRPKKPSVSTNPYELYYYTGFGPLWGKKRGPGRANLANVSKHDRGHGPASLASDDAEFDGVDDEYEEEDEFDDGKRKKARKPIKARSLKSLM